MALLILVKLILSGQLLLTSCYGAKILLVSPVPSQSQAILGSELLKGFAAIGHHVTMLSPFPLKNPPPNYKDVVLNLDTIKKADEADVMVRSIFPSKVITDYMKELRVTEAVLEDPSFKEFVMSGQEFDVVIYMQTSMDALLGMSHKFNSSIIFFSPDGATHMSAHRSGLSLPCTWVPHYLLEYSEDMTIWERFRNCYTTFVGKYHLTYTQDEEMQRLLNQYFPNSLSLQELRDNIVIELLNSHVATDIIKPHFQNMINVGGFYMKNKENVPKDIQAFLDSSKNGVVLVSFGLDHRNQTLDQKLVNALIGYFKSTPFDFLLRLDVGFKKLPANVKIFDWIPQRHVLSHKKVKLFINHGGRGSLNEAIYFKVPMVIIPFYGSQKANARFLSTREIAVELDPAYITARRLQEATREVLQNSIYIENINIISHLYNNPDVESMKRAIYWVEFVINNRGLEVFKTPASTMPLWKLETLDVIAVAILMVIGGLVLIYYCLKMLVNIFIKRKKPSQNIKEKTS